MFLMLSANRTRSDTAPDGAGEKCWDYVGESATATATAQRAAACLLNEVKFLKRMQRPQDAAGAGGRLMQNIVRAAAALSSGGSQEMMQDALELLDVALDLERTNPNLHFLRGNVLGALGQQDAAADAFQSAVTYLPHHVDALHNYAVLTMNLPERSRTQTRAVVRALQTALRLVPGSARLHLTCGLVISELGHKLAATKLLRSSLALDPSSVLATSELALTLEASGHIREAERTLQTVLAMSTTNESKAEAWRGMGAFLLRQKNDHDACAAFEKALKLDPASAEGHSGKGACLRNQGLLQLAVLSYEVAAQIDVTASTLTNFGSVLVEAGHVEEALDTLQRALNIAPDFSHASTTAGFALVELGRTSEAHALFNQAVAADPQHATAWNNLGHFLRSQHLFAESVRALLRAVAIDPLPIHRFNLAESLRMEGDMRGALRHLEIVVAEANPPLFDAAALLIFYRRLVCDWVQYSADVATLTSLLARQSISGEQAALFAVQTLVFPLPPHVQLFCAQSLSTAAAHFANGLNKGGERARGGRGEGGAGTQFTCFPGTKVQILRR